MSNEIEKADRLPTLSEDEDGNWQFKVANEEQQRNVETALQTENNKLMTHRLGHLALSYHAGHPMVEKANLALAQMDALAPRDEVEAQLCEEMIKTNNMHDTAVDFASHKDNEPESRRKWMDMANRLARTHAAQVETLRKYRTGGEQVVRHVHVNDGGQAAFIEEYYQGGRKPE